MIQTRDRGYLDVNSNSAKLVHHTKSKPRSDTIQHCAKAWDERTQGLEMPGRPVRAGSGANGLITSISIYIFISMKIGNVLRAKAVPSDKPSSSRKKATRN